jgi:Fur family transcriptional regulator, peroxide stress response regulator
MKTVMELADTVRGRGGKVTPQRLLIYQILQDDTSHPTADAVWERVREILPTVSLTTVYKTLNELVATGELKRFDVDRVTHFDPDVAPHAEAVCLSCHAIVDVPGALSDHDSEDVADFEVVHKSLTFYGYCARCARKSKTGTNPVSPTEEGSAVPTKSAAATPR